MSREGAYQEGPEESGGLSFVSAPPRGPLIGGAERLTGYEERTCGELVRREAPIPAVVVVLDLGPGIEVSSSGRTTGYESFSEGFVAGLTSRAALVRHGGHQRGIQLNLRPTLARRVFGVPLSEMEGRTVPIGCLVRDLAELRDRAASLAAWTSRLHLVEKWLTARMCAQTPAGAVADWAFQRILDANGDVDISSLARQTGYSSRHLGRLFHEHVGMSPKRFARIARFARVAHLVQAGEATGSWAAIAGNAGYADQAHLSRVVREIVGLTPTAWRRELLTQVSASEELPA